jgi:hypothetical protein
MTTAIGGPWIPFKLVIVRISHHTQVSVRVPRPMRHDLAVRLSRAGGVAFAILITFGNAMGQQSRPWPDAAVLLAKYSALVLGQFDTAAHQTRYTRQHMDVGSGVTATIEKFQRRPSELVQKTTAPDGSILLNGYNGSIAWEMHDGVARLVTGYEAEILKNAAAFYDGMLAVPAAMKATRGATIGEVRLGDDTAFAISSSGSTLAAAEAGGLPIVYISKSTGLLASVSVGGGDKTYLVHQTFGGYRDFGGLLVATEWTITTHTGTADLKHSVTIDEVRWDSVAESQLELPEAVRALIKP